MLRLCSYKVSAHIAQCLQSYRDLPIKQSHGPWKMSTKGFLPRKEAGCARWAKQGISSADLERDLYYFSSMGCDKGYGPTKCSVFLIFLCSRQIFPSTIIILLSVRDKCLYVLYYIDHKTIGCYTL